jgi:hypothetical protein
VTFFVCPKKVNKRKGTSKLLNAVPFSLAGAAELVAKKQRLKQSSLNPAKSSVLATVWKGVVGAIFAPFLWAYKERNSPYGAKA